MLIGTIGLADL